jgi:hypothetical protein
MYPNNAIRQVQAYLLYTRLGYLLYQEKPFPRPTAASTYPDCAEPYSYRHHFLQCIERIPATHHLLTVLGFENPDDTEAATMTIIQKIALQPAPLIEFLTQWPVLHFEFDDTARRQARQDQDTYEAK